MHLATRRTIFQQVKHVQIIAVAPVSPGMVARYWLEQMAGVSCNVEIASEFRYRESLSTKTAC